jgi:hypothetical protein
LSHPALLLSAKQWCLTCSEQRIFRSGRQHPRRLQPCGDFWDCHTKRDDAASEGRGRRWADLLPCGSQLRRQSPELRSGKGSLRLVLHAAAAGRRVAQARQRLLRCWHLPTFPCCWLLRLSNLHGPAFSESTRTEEKVFLLQGVFNCRACGTDTTVCTECACGYTLVRMQTICMHICWISMSQSAYLHTVEVATSCGLAHATSSLLISHPKPSNHATHGCDVYCVGKLRQPWPLTHIPRGNRAGLIQRHLHPGPLSGGMQILLAGIRCECCLRPCSPEHQAVSCCLITEGETSAYELFLAALCMHALPHVGWRDVSSCS